MLHVLVVCSMVKHDVEGWVDTAHLAQSMRDLITFLHRFAAILISSHLL